MDGFIVGMNEQLKPSELLFTMANRHGLISGATGTGKTVTLQKMAEAFAHAGIPVFTADVKGDLSGISFPASSDSKIKKRLTKLKIKKYEPQGCQTVFWDIYGKQGCQLRATISELGPLMLGRLLKLNDTQQGIVNAAFSYADDQGLLLLDLKDFTSLLNWMGENAASLKTKYGNFSASSLGAIQRGLLSLKEAGGENFFGEPAFKIDALFEKTNTGQGIVNILDATQLINNSLLYSTFLLWLLSELFEKMPEVGDVDKPKLIFFFDEAHLLFKTAPKLLLEKIEQLVRLIRSKGVGVYFVTQTPLDVPASVLGQLGNRVQHALRGFTPSDQKAIRAAAETFRKNPKLNTEKVISELGVGEALVSFLNNSGQPTIVERVKIMPPTSRIGAISSKERTDIMNASPYFNQYKTAVNRESAYEILTKKMEEKSSAPKPEKEIKGKPGRPRKSATETIVSSAAKTLGSQIGRQIIRGIMGSIFKHK